MMRLVLLYHSLISDWNHGNAHFLRGLVRELLALGHDAVVYEPRNGWSLSHLISDHGCDGPSSFMRAFPGLRSRFYDDAAPDLDRMLDGADAVIVHEWNRPELVAAIGRHRAAGGSGYALLFHDTHHRSVSASHEMARYDLEHYDGVLAFGASVKREYERHCWTRRAWTWHEGADVAHYRPLDRIRQHDLIWIGNWGDGERAQELEEYLIEPARSLSLDTTVRGVRYPREAVRQLNEAGINYGGWASAETAVELYSRHRATVHIPRRLYRSHLPGVPTIRVFEALACGVPLVCAPWDDAEHLFSPGEDFLVARDGQEMAQHLRHIVSDPAFAEELADRGRQTVLARHTCRHRALELMEILASLGLDARVTRLPAHGAPP